MASVDDLCRSYLDLKYHFDPAAASAAGLVSHDSRLGRFDTDTTREHLSALRAVAAAIEEFETEDLQAEIDRTALLGEIRCSIFRLEHEQPHVRNPAYWLSHVFQGLYVLLSAAVTGRDGRARARGAGAAAGPCPRSSTRRATRSTSRPPYSSTPRSACSAAAASWWCS